MQDDAGEPGILEQTRELGSILKQIMEDDPGATPTGRVASVFESWLLTAGPLSRQPVCFADVAQNYHVLQNSNKDLFDLFVMLEAYLDNLVEEPSPQPRGRFIGLPLVG